MHFDMQMNNYQKIASCVTLKLSNLTNNHQTMTIMNSIQNDENAYSVNSKQIIHIKWYALCISD